jgi:hypothetical protein
MINGPFESLSPQGQARREAMLDHLVGEMALVHRRRRARRAALSSAGAVLLLVGLIRFANLDSANNTLTLNPQSPEQNASVQPDASTIMHVQTDPSIAERFRAAPIPIIVPINDAQLIETLVEIGRPAGLIQVGERIALSAPVTDEELSPDH